MNYRQIAYEILQKLSVQDIKNAAKDFGVTQYYFSQKIKSIDTDITELHRAVDCLINDHNRKDIKVKELHTIFLNEVKKYK